MTRGEWLRNVLQIFRLLGDYIESSTRDPFVLCLRTMQISLYHLQPIKLFCLKTLIFAQIVNYSLLLSDWLELECLFSGFERLWCSENKRIISHGFQ